MPSSRFKPRNPDIFPVRYSDVVIKALDTGQVQVLGSFPTYAKARGAMRIFRDWRYCLRTWPGTVRCTAIEHDCIISARVEPMAGELFVLISVTPRMSAILERNNAHLSKLIDAERV